MNFEFSRILETQATWARSQDLEIGDSRHTPDLRSNLFAPLPDGVRGELEQSRRHPLGDVARDVEGGKPGDLQLLESTLALVCNLFAPGGGGATTGALAETCGGDSRTGRMRVCPTVGTAASGLSAEVDVLFETASPAASSNDDAGAGDDVGRPTAVIASYAEPYRSPRPRREPANRVSSEWLEPSGIWEALPMCRRLALDLRASPRRFEHVGAAELLLAGVSMTTQYGYRGFRLVHLWYDGGGAAAAKYRSELDRFRFRVGGELDFRSLTWQQLYAQLAEAGRDGSGPLDGARLQYLQGRYALS